MKFARVLFSRRNDKRYALAGGSPSSDGASDVVPFLAARLAFSWAFIVNLERAIEPDVFRRFLGLSKVGAAQPA